MRRFTQLASIVLLASFIAASALAQGPASVQQSATKTDVATGLFGPAGGATTCATVNTTAANATVTITPPAGQFVYITGLYVDLTQDVTGVTQVSTLSTTNITGAPFWSLATIVPTAGANGSFRQIAEVFPTALKSTAPGTAVTFVPSAQENHLIECIRVAAYFAP